MSRLTEESTYRYNELLHDGHALLERSYPQALWKGDPQRAEIALTFDDGPSAKDLGDILRVLDRHQATATFFFIGEKVPAAAQLVREVAAAGHTIGMHGYRHVAFPQVKPLLLRAELALTRTLITRLCGWPAERVRNIRPPYGVFTPTTLALLAAWGYRPVMWSLVPFHWRISAAQSRSQIQQRLTRGSLVVLHEAMVDGAPVVDLLDTTLDRARACGLRTISIDDMWAQRR